MPGAAFDVSEVLAWALIVAAVVFAAAFRRFGQGGAVALATLAAIAAKAALLPLT